MAAEGMMEQLCYLCERGTISGDGIHWECGCPGPQRPKGYVINYSKNGEFGRSGYCQHPVGSIMVYEDVEAGGR